MLLFPKLNSNQLNRLSEIYMAIGHIALASVVIPKLIPKLIDKSDWIMIIWGLITALVFWVISIVILRRKV